jgi:Sec-independent protein translocase protein TatA
MLFALIGLTYFAFRLWPASLGAAAANVFLAVITLVIGYGRQPEVAVRVTLLSELKKARASADAARRRFDEMEKRERDEEQGKHLQLLAMQSAQQQIDSREKDELIRADNVNRWKGERFTHKTARVHSIAVERTLRQALCSGKVDQ